MDEAEEVDLQTTTGLHADDYCTEPYPPTASCYLIMKQSPFQLLSKGEAQAKFHTEHQPLIYRQSLCGYAISAGNSISLRRLHGEADRLRTLYHIIYSGAATGRTFPKLFPIADKNLHPLPRVGIGGCIPHKR